MAQTDLLKRYLDAGVAFTQLSQAKAEEIVRDLVRAGEVQTEDARKRVEELVERSRQNTEGIVALVRSEVQNQVARLGLVPRADLDAVAREVQEVKARQQPTTTKAAPGEKAATKKATTKRAAPAKKATTKKASPGTKKAPAKKSTAAEKR